jgi:phage shock protein PspC (stress-responsive transcriptional regulator)
VRIIWLLVALFTGVGFIAYLVAWLVMSQGPAPGPAPLRPINAPRRLTRSTTDVKWAGVCGGIAEYLGVDSTIIRLIWAILTVVPGAIVFGFIAYFLAWAILPLPSKVVVPAGTPVAHSS